MRIAAAVQPLRALQAAVDAHLHTRASGAVPGDRPELHHRWFHIPVARPKRVSSTPAAVHDARSALVFSATPMHGMLGQKTVPQCGTQAHLASYSCARQCAAARRSARPLPLSLPTAPNTTCAGCRRPGAPRPNARALRNGTGEASRHRVSAASGSGLRASRPGVRCSCEPRRAHRRRGGLGENSKGPAFQRAPGALAVIPAGRQPHVSENEG